MKARRREATRALSVSAMLCALGVVLLGLGSLVEVLDLSMAALASFLVVLAVIELGGKYPYLIYAVTALLGLLVLPLKGAPLAYLLFMGYYPILKHALERRFRGVLCLALKLVFFNVALAAFLFAAIKLFSVLVLPGEWYYYAGLLLLSPVFLLYDVALSRVIVLYLFRLRNRFRFLHK